MDFKELVFRCVADSGQHARSATVRNNPVCRRMRKVMSKVPLLLPYCSSNASLPKNEEARKWSNGLDHLITSPCKSQTHYLFSNDFIFHFIPYHRSFFHKMAKMAYCFRWSSFVSCLFATWICRRKFGLCPQSRRFQEPGVPQETNQDGLENLQNLCGNRVSEPVCLKKAADWHILSLWFYIPLFLVVPFWKEYFGFFSKKNLKKIIAIKITK